MCKYLALALLAACELQPAPPKPAASATVTPPTPAPVQPTVPGDAGPAAPTPKPTVEVTQPCLDVAVHVANIIISTADPSQRAIFEQERERIVRGTAEACTTQSWSEAANKCFLTSNTQPELKACEAKFVPPPVRPGAPVPPTVTPPTTPPVGPDGRRPEPTSPPSRTAPNRPAPAAGAGSGSAAPARPRAPRAGSGSAAPR